MAAKRRVIAAKLTRLTHIMAIQLNLMTAVLFSVLAPSGQSWNFWFHSRILCIKVKVKLSLCYSCAPCN